MGAQPMSSSPKVSPDMPSNHAATGFSPSFPFASLDQGRLPSGNGLRSLLSVFEVFWARAEIVCVGFALTVCVLFLALDTVARLLGYPVSLWLGVLPQYLTLVVTMLGASLATRRGEHIAIDFLAQKLPWPHRIKVEIRSAIEGMAAWVALALAVAGFELMQIEREAGGLILHRMPSWWPIALIGLGFASMAARSFVRLACRSWPMAVVVFGVAISWSWLEARFPDGSLLWAGAFLLVSAFLGLPLFLLLAGGALWLFAWDGSMWAAVPAEMLRLVQSPSLVTLPLFTWMGAVLAEGGSPGRLVRLARAWLGWFPGGLLLASVLLCAFFTTFTGASGVTVLALGALLYRMLRDASCPDGIAIGSITASGSIGLLFAPALPLILYGTVAKVDIDHMFVAGIAPGILLILAVFGAGMLALMRAKALPKRLPWHGQEAKSALLGAGFELGLPIVILTLFLGGFSSIAGACAVGAAYLGVMALVIHGDVRGFARWLGLFERSASLIGAVLVILAGGLSMTYYLVDHQIPQACVAWAQEHIGSRWLFLLATNLLLLVVGCLLDIFSAIVIFVPLLLPVAQSFGVDPVHFGIMFLANLELGYLTPPVGMNLFLAAFRFERPLPEIWKTVWPFLLALFIVLLLLTYVPGISLFGLP